YGQVTWSTAGSDFDTFLAVYTGTSLSDLSLIASNDDVAPQVHTSKLTFQAQRGVTYQITVAGVFESVGKISLSLNFSQGPTALNDTFANRILIDQAITRVNGSSVGAT